MDTTNPLASSSFSNALDDPQTAETTNDYESTTTAGTSIPNATQQMNDDRSENKQTLKAAGAVAKITISTPHKPQPSKSSSNHRAMNRPAKALNPYNNISSYSHEATTVPPYALYGIANSHARDAPNLALAHYTAKQDPFIHSLNDNWNNFFEAVDSTPAYALNQLKRDSEILAGLPDLSGDWGGDERLKQYLNNEQPLSDSSTVQSEKKWYQLSSSGKLGSGRHENGNNRSSSNNGNSNSSNGYWMKTSSPRQTKTRFQRIFFYNNYVPLILRLLIIGVSIASLVLAVKIFQQSRNPAEIPGNGFGGIEQQPSTLMAIVVQSCALVYLLYISYDEFNSQPIGIRNPIEKLRLILLDLLFIIFGSANLSISFNTLYDPRWVCTSELNARYPRIDSLCEKQRGLAGCLFIVLVFWVCNLVISLMRIIHKVTTLNNSDS